MKSPKEDAMKSESTKIDSNNISNIPLSFESNVKDLEVLQIPDHLLRTHQKNMNNHYDANGIVTPLKHGSEMNLRKKKTVVEYRIKTVSKSPQKFPQSNLQNSQNQTAVGFMLKCKPTTIMEVSQKVSSPRAIAPSV